MAKDGSGRVATATDVPTEAIRIYTVDMNDIANSTYVFFSCTRTNADGSDKWVYSQQQCSATMSPRLTKAMPSHLARSTSMHTQKSDRRKKRGRGEEGGG